MRVSNQRAAVRLERLNAQNGTTEKFCRENVGATGSVVDDHQPRTGVIDESFFNSAEDRRWRIHRQSHTQVGVDEWQQGLAGFYLPVNGPVDLHSTS